MSDRSIEEFDKVIKKLKDLLGIDSDRQLAFKLNILPASFSNNKRNSILPYEKIVLLALENNISLDILFNNKVEQNSRINEDIRNEDNTSDYINIELLIDNNDYVRLPVNLKEDVNNLKAIVLENNIYVVNIKFNLVENNNNYLLKSNEVYYAKHISIDFSGNYLLKSMDGSIDKITKEEFEKIESIGKIVVKFEKENLFF